MNNILNIGFTIHTGIKRDKFERIVNSLHRNVKHYKHEFLIQGILPEIETPTWFDEEKIQKLFPKRLLQSDNNTNIRKYINAQLEKNNFNKKIGRDIRIMHSYFLYKHKDQIENMTDKEILELIDTEIQNYVDELINILKQPELIPIEFIKNLINGYRDSKDTENSAIWFFGGFINSIIGENNDILYLPCTAENTIKRSLSDISYRRDITVDYEFCKNFYIENIIKNLKIEKIRYVGYIPILKESIKYIGEFINEKPIEFCDYEKPDNIKLWVLCDGELPNWFNDFMECHNEIDYVINMNRTTRPLRCRNMFYNLTKTQYSIVCDDDDMTRGYEVYEQNLNHAVSLGQECGYLNLNNYSTNGLWNIIFTPYARIRYIDINEMAGEDARFIKTIIEKRDANKYIVLKDCIEPYKYGVPSFRGYESCGVDNHLDYCRYVSNDYYDGELKDMYLRHYYEYIKPEDDYKYSSYDSVFDIFVSKGEYTMPGLDRCVKVEDGHYLQFATYRDNRKAHLTQNGIVDGDNKEYTVKEWNDKMLSEYKSEQGTLLHGGDKNIIKYIVMALIIFVIVICVICLICKYFKNKSSTDNLTD